MEERLPRRGIAIIDGGGGDSAIYRAPERIFVPPALAAQFVLYDISRGRREFFVVERRVLLSVRARVSDGTVEYMRE